MELTILLSKVFGLYFLIIGVILLFRRSFFRTVVNMFVEEPALRFMMGVIMLLGGLFFVVSHQDWSDFNTGFISLLGWLVVIKALFYLNLSNGAMRKWVSWYKMGGVHGLIAALVYIALGVYLVNFSFNFGLI
jgi:uncharacterized membrane protein